MANQKHLSAEQRQLIQTMITEHKSFADIARVLDKHPSTITREIRSHLVISRTGYKYIKYNACKYRNSCKKTHVCKICNPDRKYKICRNCPACNNSCPDFVKEVCPKLIKPPYVCNGCNNSFTNCTLEKHYYYADRAQKEYLEKLSDSRSGFSLSEESIQYLDSVISPLIKQKQSPHHICVTNRDSIMISESTIYRLIAANLLSARNIDLPRRVRFRIRKQTVHFKVDKACRIGRKYSDYNDYLTLNPGLPVTQLDSVEGIKGGKVLLTIHFVNCEMMLAFLRDYNDARSVTAVFNKIYERIGHQRFTTIFKVCLADNGSEFSNPKAIEYNDAGELRTRVFYCNPSAPYQKGSAERNHEFIRMFIPKSTDLSVYTQDDISLMMDHINSYSRESIGNKSPYDMFAFLYGQELLDLLGCHRIPPQNVTLNKSIFSKEVQR